MVDLFENIDGDIDIEQIMKQLRERIQNRDHGVSEPLSQAPQSSVSPTSVSIDFQSDLTLINQNYNTNNIPMASAYGRLGTFVKKWISFLIRFYTSKQTEFNASLVRLLNNMTSKINLMDTHLKELEERIERMKKEQDSLSSTIDLLRKGLNHPFNKK